MTSSIPPPSASGDLFDAIARLLEPGQRAYFYERMLHFRHLRPDDELLRIVEAMGWLSLVIGEAPRAVARERAQLTELLQTSLDHLDAVAAAGQTAHEQLETRLARLPDDLTTHLSPEAIARALIESLRQQFVHSGLPATAEALSAVAEQMSAALKPLHLAAEQLRVCAGQAERARGAIDRMTTSLVQSTDVARSAAVMLSERFRVERVRSVWVLCGTVWVFGIVLGLAVERVWIWRMDPVPPPPAHAVSDGPSPTPPSPRPVAAPGRAPHLAAPKPLTPDRSREPARETPVEQPSSTDGTPVEQPWNGDGTAPASGDATPEA